MPRSPRLREQAIEAAAVAIRRMPGPVTWEGAVEAVRRAVGSTYTRQALCRHPPINAAYAARKAGAPATPAEKKRSAAVRAERATRRRLRAELDQLRQGAAALQEQLLRVSYNAFANDIDLDMLFRPLPPIDRAGLKSPKRR